MMISLSRWQWMSAALNYRLALSVRWPAEEPLTLYIELVAPARKEFTGVAMPCTVTLATDILKALQ